MKGNRKVDSSPEIAVRSALHAAGLRFRKNHRIVTASRMVTADIAFPRQRLAVLVDGCFWHSCPDHGTQPRTNRSYWGPKLQRNKERDEQVNAALVSAGWRVMRFWEHEDAEKVALAVKNTVRQLSTGPLDGEVSIS